MFPLLLVLMLFFFMIVMPQKKDRQARQEMLKNVKKNDRVVTTGGIFGVVTNVQADEVTLRVDEQTNTRLRVQLAAIASVMGDEPPAEKKEET